MKSELGREESCEGMRQSDVIRRATEMNAKSQEEIQEIQTNTLETLFKEAERKQKAKEAENEKREYLERVALNEKYERKTANN